MTTIGVKGTITVPSGKSITLGSGSSLTFNNNSSLIISGNLTSLGTSNYKITYDFITPQGTNGIRINSGGSLNITYSIIKNASTGIYINQANPTVENWEIFNCLGGIFVNNTNNIPNDPIIRNNYIRDAINI
jgi:hypothetical protein